MDGIDQKMVILSGQERKVYKFIKSYIARFGEDEAPTYKEIARGIGRSESAAHYTCSKLAERGYLYMGDGSHRAISLLK